MHGRVAGEACVAGGMHGGVCMVGQRAWQGACVAGEHVWQKTWPLHYAVRILLEYILVARNYIAIPCNETLEVTKN